MMLYFAFYYISFGFFIGLLVMLVINYLIHYENERNKYLSSLDNKEYKKYMEFRRRV